MKKVGVTFHIYINLSTYFQSFFSDSPLLQLFISILEIEMITMLYFLNTVEDDDIKLKLTDE
jgi:hypothetical protein